MTQPKNNKTRTAIFPGSFNPFTVGHDNIVKRGLELFDSLVISVGINVNKPDSAALAEVRMKEIAELYSDQPRIKVVTWDGLTADLAKKHDARFILRGVRSVKDFEYEKEIADINHTIAGIETVILFTAPEYGAISSSVVRELRSFGHDVRRFLPDSKKR